MVERWPFVEALVGRHARLRPAGVGEDFGKMTLTDNTEGRCKNVPIINLQHIDYKRHTRNSNRGLPIRICALIDTIGLSMPTISSVSGSRLDHRLRKTGWLLAQILLPEVGDGLLVEIRIVGVKGFA